jgi:murein DD-endopeptidase MepM/ murein hydrolase activator NlpD
MRRIFFWALTVLFALVLINRYREPISRATREMAGDVSLFWKAAQLRAKEPDRRLVMPVSGVRVKQVKDSWHAPRDGGERRHQGQDIFARRGTPVYSATEGYVARVGENRLGGQTVSILGAGGRLYYYAHLDAYAQNISEGDYVTPQTVLGYVGTTGNAQGTPPHLHFGVYTSTGAINPLPLLADRS